MLTCECIFRARVVYICTQKGHELSGLLVSVRSLKPCSSLRAVHVGVSVQSCETELKMTDVGMSRCGQHPSGTKLMGKNKIHFAVEWS